METLKWGNPLAGLARAGASATRTTSASSRLAGVRIRNESLIPATPSSGRMTAGGPEGNPQSGVLAPESGVCGPERTVQEPPDESREPPELDYREWVPRANDPRPGANNPPVGRGQTVGFLSSSILEGSFAHGRESESNEQDQHWGATRGSRVGWAVVVAS